MSTDVTTEVTIRRPRQEVASFVMDPANDAVWLTGIQESRQLTEPPVGKGTKVERVARFLGRRMSYVTEVVEHEAGSVIVMKSDSPFPMTITYRFEEAPEGTRMRAHLQGRWRWLL